MESSIKSSCPCFKREKQTKIPESPNPSYWDLTEPNFQYSKWNGEIGYDVAIIGGGITGLTTALLLKEAGKKVAVLERYRIGFGTTGNTTGHLTTEPDYSFTGLNRNIGKEGIQLSKMAMSEGIDIIENMSKKYEINCDFVRLPGYYYTENADSVKKIEEEYINASKANLKVKLLRKCPLPFKTHRAMKICNQGQFHSLKYINGLALAIEGNGSNIFENTSVISYEDGEPCTINIDSIKKTLKVKSIVVATHTAIGVNIFNSFVSPYRSYVIAAKIKNKCPKGLFWDTSDPYYYIRCQPDDLSPSKSGEILIVGGCDHRTGHVIDENEHFLKLNKYVKERFQIAEIYTKWSAQWYKSVDGLPYIGLSPGMSHVYMAIGYGGDGLTWGSIASKIISDLIIGVSNPYSKLLSTSRHESFLDIINFVGESSDVAVSFIKGWIRSDYKDIKNMKQGEGRIVDHGFQKVAVYKDEMGCLHKCSAVCPHMKTILKWNTAEKTWDCPAHGGRFTCRGKLIEGPPMVDLEDLGDVLLLGE